MTKFHPSDNIIDLASLREKSIIRSHQANGPVEIRKLVEECGVVIKEIDPDFFDEHSGHVSGVRHNSKIQGAVRYNHEEECFEILVNVKLKEEWKSYVIAHEFAHYALEKDKIMAVGALTSMVGHHDRNEDIANQFATSTLVSGRSVKLMLVMGKWNVKMLAEAFRVPFEVMDGKLSRMRLWLPADGLLARPKSVRREWKPRSLEGQVPFMRQRV